jgi:hypothetical protein
VASSERARALSKVVAAFTRAIRAMGYYDANHPVFEQTKKDAFAALEEAWRMRAVVTLGCAGRHLVIDEDGTSLRDEPSMALARRMFDSSLVAIRVHDVASAGDVGALMKVLAESPEKVRAGGGARSILEGDQTRGVDVLEVDFGALFAGTNVDLSPIIGDDPVAKLALEGVLRLEQEDAERSEAIAIGIEKVSTPDSLGSFLDHLLDDAHPDALADGGAASGNISSDDLADFAARAYFASHERSGASGKIEHLAQSARVLSNALVRLSPEARFALLRRLAGGDTIESAGQERAIRQLGGELGDSEVVGAIAHALVDRTSDSDAVKAIGNLIRRIRPVEAERRRLMQAVDDAMFAKKKPIDGVLWQQIQAQAMDQRGLGLLEMGVDAVKPGLVRAAKRRIEGRTPAAVGQEILSSLDRRSVGRRSARALARVLASEQKLGDVLLEAAERAIASLSADDGACLDVLSALIERTATDRDPKLAALVAKVLAGERGALLSTAILARGTLAGSMRGELLLNALDGPGDRAFKDALIAELAKIGPDALLEVGARAVGMEPMRVLYLVKASSAADPKVGLKVAKVALHNPNVRVKEVAIKELADHPSVEALGLLAHVAGWKGERHVHALLAMDGKEPHKIHKLQMAAIGALGLSRAPAAARPLFDLLTQKRLFENKESEEIRIGAAQALVTNGTAEAKAALEEGAKHKKKNVREVCERVVGRKR